MDRLAAFVAISHAKLRLQYLQRHPEILEGIEMTSTPKLQSLAKAMAMLESGLEDGAGELLTKISLVNDRGLAAIARGHQKVDAKAGLVAEIETFVTALEGSNGGDPLEGSSSSSDQSQPEKLTTNGVSVG